MRSFKETSLFSGLHWQQNMGTVKICTLGKWNCLEKLSVKPWQTIQRVNDYEGLVEIDYPDITGEWKKLILLGRVLKPLKISINMSTPHNILISFLRVPSIKMLFLLEKKCNLSRNGSGNSQNAKNYFAVRRFGEHENDTIQQWTCPLRSLQSDIFWWKNTRIILIWFGFEIIDSICSTLTRDAHTKFRTLRTPCWWKWYFVLKFVTQYGNTVLERTFSYEHPWLRLWYKFRIFRWVPNITKLHLHRV